LRQHYAEVWAQSNSSACHGFFFFDLNTRSSGDYGKNMDKHANQNTRRIFGKSKTQDVAAQ